MRISVGCKTFFPFAPDHLVNIGNVNAQVKAQAIIDRIITQENSSLNKPKWTMDKRDLTMAEIDQVPEVPDPDHTRFVLKLGPIADSNYMPTKDSIPLFYKNGKIPCYVLTLNDEPEREWQKTLRKIAPLAAVILTFLTAGGIWKIRQKGQTINTGETEYAYFFPPVNSTSGVPVSLWRKIA